MAVDFEAIFEKVPKDTMRLYERNPKFRLSKGQALPYQTV